KQTWIDNNPVDLATTYDFSSGPSLYLSCGTKDSWGCMEGSLSIVKSLQANGGAIEWVPRPGGHCDVDSISVAEFLRPSEKRKLRSAKIESNERIDRPFR
ncbi:MAG: hypothetical protein NTV34_17190, partial [Proteobacteria bacterium]|nr:hypothetical protein [Pseudomonadota bacterium]